MSLPAKRPVTDQQHEFKDCQSSTTPSRCARTTGPVGGLTGCPQRRLEPFQKSCGRCAGWARLREPACFRQDLECAGLTALFRQRPPCRSASPSSQAFGECVTGLKSGVEPPQSKTSRTSPKTRRTPAPVCFGANDPTRELTGCPQRRLGDRYCESNSSASECRATRTSLLHFLLWGMFLAFGILHLL